MTLLQALPENTWIIDGNNSIPEQLTWTAKYWGYIYRSDSDEILVKTEKSPFYGREHTNLNFLTNPNDNPAEMDFHEADGWELLHAFLGDSGASLGSSNPAVILYNKEKGVMRFFTMNIVNPTARSAAFIEFFAENNNTGIISTINNGKNYLFSLNQRNNDESKETMLKNYVTNHGGWLFADFPVTYDNLPPNPSNLFRFRARIIDEYNSDAIFTGGITGTHSTINSSNTPGIVTYGNYIYEYIKQGNGLQNEIESIPTKLTSNAFTADFVNFLNSGINFLQTTGITASIPWIYTVAGIINNFGGNKDSVSYINWGIKANYSGTTTYEADICDFTLIQPGAVPNQMTFPPTYNEPLGVVHLINTPHYL